MNPSKNELKAKQEFEGSSGKGHKLPPQESIKPVAIGEGSAGKGSLPKAPNN